MFRRTHKASRRGDCAGLALEVNRSQRVLRALLDRWFHAERLAGRVNALEGLMRSLPHSKEALRMSGA